ncbi:MAG: hypothetical protein COU10_03005 [Candidatus Harrisonbacteria bacterium CG10_big_fil_rev_8_21_14_0_10_45_28]|uniref:Uncharacterized protein n=1 Tax=Candidatus Harrisonbacteria bacterium CG10_big_fil_rev_8_21_14_0_10_45_28 TaxID=1974586 RepID=A0A2H0UMZ0_9BACT|nr:MAG: hypothetical protein COU10_03005 [Candidatus Harrisonbacteria bacterium CG10_big_fil_rev_8_21_14_0_10_45_28]
MNKIISTGIDVSKDKLDVALLDQGQVGQLGQFENNVKGIRELIKLLKHKGATSAPLIIESTGEYHLSASFMLQKDGFKVNCINPLITKQYERASIRGAKTDRVDALRLAKIGILENNLPVFQSSRAQLKAKKYASLLAILEHQAQALKQSMASVEKNQALFSMRAKSKRLARILTLFKEEITDLKSDLADQLPDSWQECANATKGVSRAELGILHALLAGHEFSPKDKLVAFLGLDVRKRQSGSWQSREHLSKRGSPYGRKVLYQIAWGLMMHNPKYKQYYQSLRKRKKPYLTAMAALSRKFLRNFYATVLKPEMNG